MAMIIVLGVMVVLTMVSTFMFSQAIAQLPLARHDQDHEAALHAAEAGVEDYINHLNANNNYFAFSSNTAVTPRPSPENPAFQGWEAVPGLPATNESFRYSVNNTDTGTRGLNQPSLETGTVYVTSSGMAGTVVRTVRAGLRKVGFLDFVYFTDYEIQDPVLSQVPISPNVCVLHAWEYRPAATVTFSDGSTNDVPAGYGPDIANSPAGWSGTHTAADGTPGVTDCPELIYFGSDTLTGPVHSNDEIHICGAPNFPATIDTYFNQLAGTSVPLVSQFGPKGAAFLNGGCVNAPVYGRAGDPGIGLDVPFPTTNAKLINSTTVLGGVGGCLYSGPTSIVLHVVAGAGVMDVTNNSSAPPVGPPGFNCGGGGTQNNLPLASTKFNGVIYDRNVPAPNPCVTLPAPGTCAGNMSVRGTLAGQLSIGSDNNITITGNLVYNGGLTTATATDVLGLSAQNNVIYQHPSNCTTTSIGPPLLMSPPGCLPDLTVDAAIVSLAHSVYVDNYTKGDPMGHLYLNGTLAQEFRGAVGLVGGSGYKKAYVWDSRLRFLSPPYFIDAGQTSFEHIAFSELLPTSTP